MTEKLFWLCIAAFLVTVATYSILDDSAKDPYYIDDPYDNDDSYDIGDGNEGRKGRICKYM